MPAAATDLASPAKGTFPLAEVQARLRGELEEAEAESVILHSGWQPVLDSLRMVTAGDVVEVPRMGREEDRHDRRGYPGRAKPYARRQCRGAVGES